VGFLPCSRSIASDDFTPLERLPADRPHQGDIA
jgi:hypothetical protein